MSLDHSLAIKQEHPFDRVLVYLATGLFTVNIIMVCLIVLGRQVSGLSFTYLHPLARYTLVIAVYFGAAIASRNHQHISIRYLMDKLEKRRPRTKRFIDVLSSGSVFFLVLILFLAAAFATMSNWGRAFSDTSIIRAGHLYLGICIGLGFMLVYETNEAYQKLRVFYETVTESESSDDMEGT